MSLQAQGLADGRQTRHRCRPYPAVSVTLFPSASGYTATMKVGIMDASFREMRRCFGNGAAQVTGNVDTPSARNLIACHYDPMARTTVEDPDLAHRTDRSCRSIPEGA
jgi:hypothetical protein